MESILDLLGDVLGPSLEPVGNFWDPWGPSKLSEARNGENAKTIETRNTNQRIWASWGHLGALLGRLGGILGRLEAVLERLEAILGRLGGISGHLGLVAILDHLRRPEGELCGICGSCMGSCRRILSKRKPLPVRAHVGSLKAISAQS